MNVNILYTMLFSDVQTNKTLSCNPCFAHNSLRSKYDLQHQHLLCPILPSKQSDYIPGQRVLARRFVSLHHALSYWS